jgi:ribosomal protein uS13
MARIAGVDLPPQKRAEIGLTDIFGIGRARANSLLARASVSPDKKIRDLTEEEVNTIRHILEEEGAVEGDLRKEVTMNIRSSSRSVLTAAAARATCRCGPAQPYVPGPARPRRGTIAE